MSTRSTPRGTPERGGLTRRSLDLLNASFSQQDDLFVDDGGGDSSPSLGHQRAPAPAQELSGELLKRSDHLKRWNSRYFVLSGDHLRYYKKPSDRFTRGNLNMAGVFVRQTSPRQILVKGKPLFCFELGHPASKQRIRVGARTPSSAQQWEKALRAAASGGGGRGGRGEDDDTPFARMASMQSMSVVESEEGISLHEEEVESGEEEAEEEEAAEKQEEKLEEDNKKESSKERVHVTPRGSPQNTRKSRSPQGGRGNLSPPHASPSAAAHQDQDQQQQQQQQQQQPLRQGARSPIALPTSNPIVDAGLSTGIVVAAILIPLATMHVGRFVLPWWIGEDRAAMRDLVGNLMFVVGFQAVVIGVMLQRQRR
jgi:hypothetical protein